MVELNCDDPGTRSSKASEGPKNERPTDHKDVWDKLSTLSTLVSTVVIGAAGVLATYLYNNRELEIKHLEKEQEEGRLREQAASGQRIELTKQLDSLYKYISSEKDADREFGYAMFAALGQGDLVIKLTKIKSDSAGAAVAQALSYSSNPTLSREAKNVELTLRINHWLQRAPSKADGSAINQDNLAALRKWMDLDPSLRGTLVTDFLLSNDPKLEEARQKAIAALHIPQVRSIGPCGQRQITDVPEDDLPPILDGFKPDNPTDLKQTKDLNGRWTVTAIFPPCQ